MTTEEILHLLVRIQRRQSTCLEFLTMESSGCGHVRYVGVWVEGWERRRQREDDHFSLFAHFMLGVLLVSNKTCCSLHYILATALSDSSLHYCVVCDLERAELFRTLDVHSSVSILKGMHCFTDSFEPMCIYSPAHKHRRNNQNTHHHTDHIRTHTRARARAHTHTHTLVILTLARVLLPSLHKVDR